MENFLFDIARMTQRRIFYRKHARDSYYKENSAERLLRWNILSFNYNDRLQTVFL